MVRALSCAAVACPCAPLVTCPGVLRLLVAHVGYWNLLDTPTHRSCLTVNSRSLVRGRGTSGQEGFEILVARTFPSTAACSAGDAGLPLRWPRFHLAHGVVLYGVCRIVVPSRRVAACCAGTGGVTQFGGGSAPTLGGYAAPTFSFSKPAGTAVRSAFRSLALPLLGVDRACRGRARRNAKYTRPRQCGGSRE